MNVGSKIITDLELWLVSGRYLKMNVGSQTVTDLELCTVSDRYMTTLGTVSGPYVGYGICPDFGRKFPKMLCSVMRFGEGVVLCLVSFLLPSTTPH